MIAYGTSETTYPQPVSSQRKGDENLGLNLEFACEIPPWLGRRMKHSLQGCGNLSKQTRFKNLEGKLERESPKRTVFASGGLGLLQMVSELDTGLCASEEAEP